MRDERRRAELLAIIVDNQPWPSFWDRVNKTDGCWEWTGDTSHQGYGIFSFTHDHGVLAHRASKAMELGFALPSSIYVLHRCDNRVCVRPDHLFLGDREANFRDMVQKRRHHFGERTPHSILNEDQVREIRVRRARGERPVDLGEMFGVSRQAIYSVTTMRNWKHVQ